jgi:hypothetical protein
MFTGRAKSGRMIGEPDNQRPDKGSSNLFACVGMWFKLFRRKNKHENSNETNTLL